MLETGRVNVRAALVLELVWIEPSRQLTGKVAILVPGDQNQTLGSAAWARQLYQASNQTSPSSMDKASNTGGASLTMSR